MNVIRRKGWELPEREATPERLFLNRRQFAGAAAAAISSLALGAKPAAAGEDPSLGLYPAVLNPVFKDAGRAITPLELNTTFNNFYEFGSSKRIARAAEALPVRPWHISVEGLVEKPFEVGVDDLLRKVSLEERISRHRCVEAWAMTVPWTGFPLRRLVELARPLAGAKYVRFETFFNPAVAKGQRPGLFSSYPWPYVEGVTMAEAANELAFVVCGAYGKPLPKSMGAPLRLHFPWKYGFKSIKSIVRVTFTEARPVSFWEAIQASEYGFWANVNPEVPHPRWSQARERLLGTDDEVDTKLFNGYGEFVASLYTGLEGERLFA